jgi:cation diffusion facilitator CzcD-associated flavoprotein CzcO
MSPTDPLHVRVALVGAGFSGIAAAVALKRDGVEDFVILERAAEVGGVWRDNSYPGIACDIPSSFYSLAAAPNPDWSHTFARGAQIAQYARDVVDDAGLRRHVRFGEELLDAAWDEASQRWTITTTTLDLTAAVLVDCSGALAEPATPALPGLQTFEGTTFHSALWDHDHDLAGARVAVIGTGASAIQFVPEIQPKVSNVVVFQRTPAWVIPRADRRTTALERRLFRAIPALQRLQRSAQLAVRELLLFPIIRRRRAAQLVLQAIGRTHLRRQVPDRRLRAKLMPNFEIGCKRILISNDWYRALAQPNVDVVSGSVREVRAHSVVDSHGVEHPVDTIIFGTGFAITTPRTIERIRGRNGRSLAEVWNGAPRHFKAIEVAGFPNYFRIGGAGCGVGHGSMIFQIESQTAFLVDALKTLAARDVTSVEVTRAAQDAYVRDVVADLAGTVWMAGGCQSWYQDANGEATTMWPGRLTSYRRQTSHFEPADHHVRMRVAA